MHSGNSTAGIQAQLFTEEHKQTVAPEAPRQINYENIHFESQLGFGGQATVKLGHYMGKPIAIKVYMHPPEVAKKQLAQELNTLKATFPSEYVVKPIGYCQHPPVILIEYVENGALDDYLQHHGNTLTFQQLMIIANDMALGILRLLEVNMVHRDIKTANTLITKQLRAKICDFDGSRNKDFKPDEFLPFIGTSFYLAPEYYFHSTFKLKCDGLPAADVFNFGVVLIELFVNNKDGLFKKYEGCYNSKQYSFETDPIYSKYEPQQKITLLHQILRDSDFSKVPIRLQADLKNIIKSCIAENPEYRPTMDIIQRKLQNIVNTLHLNETVLKTKNAAIHMAQGLLSAPSGQRECRAALFYFAAFEKVRLTPSQNKVGYCQQTLS